MTTGGVTSVQSGGQATIEQLTPGANANQPAILVQTGGLQPSAQAQQSLGVINDAIDNPTDISAQDVLEEFETMDAASLRQVMADLQQQGRLDDLARTIMGVEFQHGLTYGDRQDLFAKMASSLDAQGVMDFAAAIEKDRIERPNFTRFAIGPQFAEAVAANADLQTRMALVDRLAADGSWSRPQSYQAHLSRELLQSLSGADAAAAFSAFSRDQLADVIESSVAQDFLSQPLTTAVLGDPGATMADFNALMASAASINGESALKADIFRIGSDLISRGPSQVYPTIPQSAIAEGGVTGLSDLLTSDAEGVIEQLRQTPENQDAGHLRRFAAQALRYDQLDALNQVTIALTLTTAPAVLNPAGAGFFDAEMATRGFYAASVALAVDDVASWREGRAGVAGELFDAAASFVPGPGSKLLKLGYNEVRDALRGSFQDAARASTGIDNVDGLYDAFYLALAPRDANGALAYGTTALSAFDSSFNAALRDIAN